MLKFHLVIAILVLTMIGCSQVTQAKNPQWINELIVKFEGEPLGNPPQSIWRYQYKGQLVYYVPPQCCDQFSTLYDINGTEICAPDGGLAGSGNGKCPDFFTSKTNEKLVWKDARKR